MNIDNKIEDHNIKNNEFLLMFCYQIKLNEKELGENTIKTRILQYNNDKKILLCEQIVDFYKFFEGKNSNIIKISLKIDYIYSLIITFLSKNIDKLLQSPNIKTFNEGEILGIIRNMVKMAVNQEKILYFLNKWGKYV